MCILTGILSQYLVNRFYKNLLSTKFSNDCSERENETELFFNGITLKLLSEDNKLFCEKDLTMIECKKAIDSLPSDKSPGSDGLSSNFYKFLGGIAHP